MKWYHIFVFPKYISSVESSVDTLNRTTVLTPEFKALKQLVEDQGKQISLLQDTIKQMEKVVQVTPVKNEIEEQDEGWDEVDENYRIPIVSGIKIGEEGQDVSKAKPLNIYGFGETGIRPVKDHGSRQIKTKTN